MRSGNLRHKIDLLRPVTESDGMGGQIETWETYATVWAGIWPLKANEQIEAFKTEMKVTHKVLMRYLSGVSGDMKIRFGTREFEIVSIINPDERDISLTLLCEEIV